MKRFADTPESREEFLEALRELLTPLSETERNDALRYYTEYFDDAGIENEKAILNELKSPKAVADRILEESGYQITRIEEEEAPFEEKNSEPKQEEQKTPFYRNPVTVVLIIIVAIFTLPIWITAIALIISAIATVASLVIGLFGVALGFMGGGVAMIIAGFVTMVSSFYNGLLALGTGLAMFGLGLILIPLLVKICVTLIPLTIKGLVYICKLPFRKRGTLNEVVL